MNGYNGMYIYTHTHNEILLSLKKEEHCAICNNMDGPWRPYAKWNKSERERQMIYDLTYMWNIKIPEFMEIEIRSVVSRGGGWWVGELGESDQKLETFDKF